MERRINDPFDRPGTGSRFGLIAVVIDGQNSTSQYDLWHTPVCP